MSLGDYVNKKDKQTYKGRWLKYGHHDSLEETI